MWFRKPSRNATVNHFTISFFLRRSLSTKGINTAEDRREQGIEILQQIETGIPVDKERRGYKVVFSVMEIVAVPPSYVIHLHSSPCDRLHPTSYLETVGRVMSHREPALTSPIKQGLFEYND
jgi:hypothetical protein